MKVISSWHTILMTADKFNEILDFIRDENIVCPMPDYWNLIWKEICGTKINADFLVKLEYTFVQMI